MSKKAYVNLNTGTTSRPTLLGPYNFDAEKDATHLREAMKGLGTDEEALIEVLTKRTSEQREEIVRKYKSLFGKSLQERIHSELSGHFRRVMELLVMNDAERGAYCLFRAMKGAGTDEDTIIQILGMATNSEISELKKAYRKFLDKEGVKDPSRSLEKDLESDLSGCFKKVIIAIVQGQRDEVTAEDVQRANRDGVERVVNMKKVGQDFDDIYDAGAGRMGTDEATFIRIFANRSHLHLRALNQYYKSKTGKSLEEAVKSETSGDFRRVLSLILSVSLDECGTYADLLRRSMAGAGTDDQALMRIIVSRSEIDMKDISDCFTQTTGKTLESWIRGDTSGDYRKALLSLAGYDWKTK